MRVYKVYGKHEMVPVNGSRVVVESGFVYTNPSSICDEYFYNTDDRIIEMVRRFGIHSNYFNEDTTPVENPVVYINIDHDFSSRYLPSGPVSMKIVKDIKNEIRDERINDLLGIREYYNGK